MSAKLDLVLDELLDARRVWDTPYFRTAALVDSVPLENPTERDLAMAQGSLTIERSILDSPDVFFVEPDMHRLILAAGETFEPEPLLSTDLITPSGYVRLPEPIHVSPVGERREGFITPSRMTDPDYIPEHSAFGWAKVPLSAVGTEKGEGILLSFFHTRDDVPDLRGTPIYPSRYIGWPLKDTMTEENWNRVAERWHPDYLYPRVFFRLIMQRITQIEASPTPRAVRRRHEREGYEPGRYSVVRLRRRTSRAEPEGEAEKREWTHRWIVGGHWRQQWYPSLGEHRQVWISDYVKGPEDKELIIRPRFFDVRD